MDKKYRVNGSFLPRFNGQNVVIIGKVTNSDPNGMSFDMMSSDNTSVTVKLNEPLQEPIEDIVEVHGVAMGRNTIQSDNCIVFPPKMAKNFDMTSYNETVVIINTEKNPWRQE